MVTFYTTHCPRCNVLKKKLDASGIEYDTNEDVDEMLAKGYQSAPFLEVDGTSMNFKEAVNWIKEQA